MTRESRPPVPVWQRLRRAAPRCTALLALVTAAVAQQKQPPPLPPTPREFRAVWVATVANIDWPSKPGLSETKQRAEAVAILDRLVELNMNAVVFQVRPQADALYQSELEPWSFYLTGKQGRAPSPFYDPLAFWIEEAHARGIQLHAWFNPYRAGHPSQRGEPSANSLIRARPELVVELAEPGYWWMDPALESVQEHSTAVVMDVVRRYDVDGVHFDDYFYPYRSYNGGDDFPDDASWAAYRATGGALSRDDWRRDAVDRFIERLAREIKAAKPHVEFGISPFGIWRPGHPPGIEGLDQYAVLYADARKWIVEGYVDYLSPQLYWPIARLRQSFPVLLGWWRAQNAHDRHLWPGLSIGRASGAAGVTEIVNQLMISRGMTPDDAGVCMFSMKTLLAPDSELVARLKSGPYASDALIPASPWLDAEPPKPPELKLGKLRGERIVAFQGEDDVAFYVVSELRDGAWTQQVLPGSVREHALDDRTTRVAVRAVDRSRNESDAVERGLD